MAFISTFWYAVLTVLGLSIPQHPRSPPGTSAVGRVSSVGSCSGLQVTDGSVSCSNNGRQTVCEVECGGKYHGKFTCTEEEGWSPELPTCARPTEEPDRIALTGGCPDVTKCNIACQENYGHPMKGSCVGSDKTVCRCETPQLTSEQSVNAEATQCNEEACAIRCALAFIPKPGKCVGGVCRCGY